MSTGNGPGNPPGDDLGGATSNRTGTVLVTGVGRRRGIGAGIALHLAEQGWDLPQAQGMAQA